jgi:hypothetical protein
MKTEQKQSELGELRQLLKIRMAEARKGLSVPFDQRVLAGIRQRGLKRLKKLK